MEDRFIIKNIIESIIMIFRLPSLLLLLLQHHNNKFYLYDFLEVIEAVEVIEVVGRIY